MGSEQRSAITFRRNGINIHWSSSWHTLLVLLFMSGAFLLLYRLHLFIFSYSHDWEYGWLLDSLGRTKFARHHYFEVNGRLPVHFFVGLLSTDDIGLWRLLNPSVMVGYVALLYRLINVGTHSNVPLAAMLIGLLLAIDQSAAQSGLYWLTGSVNYAWPTVLAVTVFAILFRDYTHRPFTTGAYLLPLLGLIAGWSTEQGGAIALGLCGSTIIWFGLVRRRPVHVSHWVTLAAIAIGYALLIFSPGNDVRIGNHGAFYSQPFLARTAIRIGEVCQQLMASKAFFLTNLTHLVILLALSWRLRAIDRGLARLNLILPILVALLLLVQLIVITSSTALTELTGIPAPSAWTPLWSTTLVTLCLTASLYIAYLAFENDYGLLYPLFYLGAIGSQLLLVLAPPDSGRLFIPGIILFIASTASLYHQSLTAISSPVIRRGLMTFLSIFLIVVGVKNYLHIYSGYKTNNATNSHNAQTIGNHLNNPGTSQLIVLSRLPAPDFQWEMPYQNSYFIPFFFRYYDIPEDAILIWIGSNTDDRQRMIVDALPEFERTLATDANLLFGFGGCDAHYWNHYIIFSVQNWTCSALWKFDITSTLTDGSIAFYKNQVLYFDQYMPVVQNLERNFRSYHSYRLPYKMDEMDHLYVRWGTLETTITWPGN